MTRYFILHKTGRARSGRDQAGTKTHLKPENDNRALCGAKPGKLGGWSDYTDMELTCPKCLKFEHEHYVAQTIQHVDPSPLDGACGDVTWFDQVQALAELVGGAS